MDAVEEDEWLVLVFLKVAESVKREAVGACKVSSKTRGEIRT